MSLANSVTIETGYEPISGYILEEKIGEGGFGEVWKANAPGDLKKAVKFVFGATDAKRGSRELRSLERIKGVQHPFLLALERYEIVQDRLVIVTELADGSLEDIHKKHLERGSCGIPRDVLLGYLHDAADALDYLHARHQLQHLDVKPGNLLIVGEHVKVGDFGLLKDLQDCDQSIVGGLTPTYAPPELFDGRPSINSDQYSLAVMFQELLTGTRPFDGRTIAQLATQHIHAAPNIEALPPADRVAVARALEKNPDRRFDSCKEFIEALRCPPQRETPAFLSTKEVDSPAADVDGEVENLPEVKGDESVRTVIGHALVVGLGGTGADIVCELNRRVKESGSSCPLDLQSVLVDTDMHSLHAVRNSDPSDGLPKTTTVHTPLRSASDYRSGGNTTFRSVSRRWIYNVPRSGTTEGMRPLGRLAMVDHAEKIDQALRQAISRLSEAGGDQIPSVYVVGSLSGGTGSGMVFDVISRVRTLLDEAGLEHVSVLPLLASVSLQGNPHQPLTLLDTFAASAELQYFLMPGHSYPGDAGAKWPAVPAARSPLKDAYLIVDADLADKDAPCAAATIVDYLWCDATNMGGYLAKARRADPSDVEPARPGVPVIRSVGIARLKCVRLLEQNQLGPAAARRLLLRWLGHPSGADSAATGLADQLKRRAQATPEFFLADVLERFGNGEAEIGTRLDYLLAQRQEEVASDLSTLDRLLLSVLEETEAAERLRRRSSMTVMNLRRELLTRLHDRRADVTTSVAALEQVEKCCHEVVRRYREPAEPESSPADRHAKQLTTPDGPPAVGMGEPIDHPPDLQPPMRRIARDRLDLFARMMVADQFEQLIKAIQQLSRQLSETAVQVVRATRQLPVKQRGGADPLDEMPTQLQPALDGMLDRLHTQLVGKWLIGPIQTDQYTSPAEDAANAMAEEVLATAGEAITELVQRQEEADNATSSTTASVALMRPADWAGGSDSNAALPSGDAHLQQSSSRFPEANPSNAAQQANKSQPATVVSGAANNAATSSLGLSTQPFQSGERRDKRWGEQTTVESALRVACPSLLRCGGRQRLLLVVGSEAERESLEPVVREAHAGELSCTVVPGSVPMLIHEAQQIPVDQLLKRLEMVSGADATVGRRLHARSDISWSEI